MTPLDLGALLARAQADNDLMGIWVNKTEVAALVRAVQAAQKHRATSAALTSRLAFGDTEGAPRSKAFLDGTPHSVDEMGRRLDENIAAREALDEALAPFRGDQP